MRCVTPIRLKNDRIYNGTTYQVRNVPCGRCYACLMNRREQWTIRLTEELKVSKSAFFITLTYEDENLPINDGVATLDKKDVQDFMKRLRHTQNEKIRYYISGEYGPNTWRPHYHGIIFNLIGSKSVVENKLFEAWKKGFISIGNVTKGRIRYVSGYIVNKQEFVDFEALGLQAPFALMSRRPGIGADYIDKMKKWHQATDERFYYPENSQKKTLPRFYRDKIYTDVQKSVNALKMEKKDICDPLPDISFKELQERILHANDQYLKQQKKNKQI